MTADADLRRLQRKWENEDAHFRRQGLQSLASTYPGRRLLWDLIDAAGTFGQPFSSENPHATAFNCGMMEMGKFLLDQVLETEPNLFLILREETAALQSSRAKEKLDVIQGAETL
jgi:hypothetical protein